MTRQVQRMVTRAAVTRLFYDLREAADRAAETAVGERLYADSDAEFHGGRQAGLLTAMNMLAKILDEED
jgi:hypothetical protein